MSHHLTAIDTFLGLKLLQVAAGFMGGIVRALIAQVKTIWTVVSSAIVGAIVAGYVTPAAVPFMQKQLGLSEGASLEPITGFILGLCSMTVCEGIINRVSAVAKPKQPEKG